MPPKVWDEHELALAGAINVGPMEPPSLTNKIHKLLRREYWQVEDREYETLLPSLRLASHWIDVAMPYIATFLPSNSVHGQLNSYTEVDEIALRKSIKIEDLQAASDELDEIALSTKWQVNYEMLAERGWLGITRLAPEPRPWGNLDPMQIRRGDVAARERGCKRRPLIIGVMGQYIEVLDEVESTSERYLRASFMAAYTITHEIGHLIFHQDFRSLSDDLSEPFVDGDHWSELGFSFMAWIFSGYNPDFSDLGEYLFDFEGPLHWEALLKGNEIERPVYKPLYSISMNYIQDIFTDSFWTKIGDSTNLSYSATARGKLKPNINGIPTPATAMLPQFHKVYGQLKWKSKHGDRGYCPELDQLLTEEEIALEMGTKRTVLGFECLLGQNAAKEGDSGSENGNFASTGTTRPWFNIARVGAGKHRGSRHGNSEEEWGRAPDSVETPDKKFASLIDDGWVEADIPLTNRESQHLIDEEGTPNTTRVEVRYLPDVPVTAPAPPPDSSSRKRHKSAPSDQVGAAKRNKLGSSSKDAADDDVDTLFEIWSIRNAEARFTHIQAYDYCSKHDIYPGNCEASAMWQESRLDGRKDQRDKFLVESMRQHAFLEAQAKYDVRKEEDVRSLLRLKIEMQNSVEQWGPRALIEHCKIQGLSQIGDLPTLRGRVSRWFRDDIQLTKQNYDNAAEIDVEFSKTNDPATWNKGDFDSYFRVNNLPSFGTPKCLQERVLRHQEEKEKGHPASRNTKSIYVRTNKDGQETYVYKAKLTYSTVQALKSALFITGRFYPESILSLYFGADRAHPLKDEDPLSNYQYKDWTTLILRVTEKRTDEGEDLTGQEAVIYQPRGQRNTGKGKVLLDRAIRRAAEIQVGKVKPTIGERIRDIQNMGEELNQATMPSGGRDILHPHTRTMKSTSAVEMLDSFEHIEELRERAKDMFSRGF